jgi:hypothetical protein
MREDPGEIGPVLVGRKPKIDTRDLLDELASGSKPRVIAAKHDLSYSTFRRRLSRYVRSAGFTSVEQAVANHLLDRVRAFIPTGMRSTFDLAFQRYRAKR